MTSATPAPSGTLDFGRVFTRVTQDPDWIKKVLIGGGFILLSVVLVGVPFVLGYYGRTLRNTAADAPHPLPDWDDLGGLFSEGLQLTAVYLAYAVGLGAFGAAVGCVLMLPAMLAGSSDNHQAGAAVAALSGLAVMVFYGLIMLLSLALAAYMPAALARAAMQRSIAAGFDWRANVAFIRANLGNYLLAVLITLLTGFVAQFGMLLCCVGVFPAAFWGQVTGAVAVGEVVRLNPTSV